MPPPGVRPVILVVDDDDGVRQTLQLVLDEDFDVLDAADAAAAIAIASSGPIDIVLVDLLMPYIDGLQLLEQLNVVRPGVPVVILSALDHASTAAAAMRLGAVDYLTKPFDERLLLDVLRAALRRRPAAQAAIGPRPFALILGSAAPVVAGLKASLQRFFDVGSYAELPPDPVLLNVRRPAIMVVGVRGHRAEWLARTALILDHFYPVPAIIVMDGDQAVELRFASASDHTVLKQPVALTAILAALDQTLPDVVPRTPWRDDRVAAVMNGVFEDCGGFELQSVARRLGVSPRYLSRAFMRAVGISIGSYVATVRVHTAAHMLQHTDAKIDEVATEVGFHDASHLSRAFVRFTGRRPGEFRK